MSPFIPPVPARPLISLFQSIKNPSIDIFEQHEIRQSVDFWTQKEWNVRSGF